MHISNYLKEHRAIFVLFSINRSVKHPHLNTIHKDPECPLLLHYLNSSSNRRKVGTGNVLANSMEHFYENLESKAFFERPQINRNST